MILRALLITLFLVQVPANCFAWINGPSGNAPTDDPSECDNPHYATHDWIADHALALLPDEEKEWLLPHKTIYLLGSTGGTIFNHL